jgi:hypothetical protein
MSEGVYEWVVRAKKHLCLLDSLENVEVCLRVQSFFGQENTV